MNPRISNIGFVIAVLIAVALGIAFITQSGQLKQAQAALLKSDKDIDKQVKSLESDTARYALEARSYERFYMEDNDKLNALQQSFDSMGHQLTKINAIHHANLIRISRLSDNAADSLYRATIQKYSGLISGK